MEKMKILLIAFVFLLWFAAFAQEKPKSPIYDKNQGLKQHLTPFQQIKIPLYILDGKEVSQQEVSALKPETIDSINVIKDYASIALYGSKGNNGIIFITSKKSAVIAPLEQK